ncbi:MAG: phosphatidylglycerol lysyltransferase domain-containing protein [Lawsonibacter sp.]|nr:phosphatidylglycerol lysyltransferase domain-containing protein [Lawsonibacter sp.]
MLDFHPLQLDDLPKLRQFFGYSGSRICDTTPGTIFIWRDMYKTEWATYDGSLYFKVIYPGLGETFTLPLGGGRQEHFRQIADYCCGRDMPIAFYPVPKDELERLQQFFPNSAAIAERNSFDYLYRAEDLKYFHGKKLSGQRNHVNKFLKTYGSWSFRPITPEDIPSIKAFLARYASLWDKSAASFHEDIRKTNEVLDNFQTYDLLGGMLVVEGEIAGFSLGEVVGDTLFTHIEKADRDYEGCYQMLVAQFAQLFAQEGIHFINREDDTGDLGLRTSKLSYHPVALLEKFTVTVENPCGYSEP